MTNYYVKFYKSHRSTNKQVWGEIEFGSERLPIKTCPDCNIFPEYINAGPEGQYITCPKCGLTSEESTWSQELDGMGCMAVAISRWNARDFDESKLDPNFSPKKFDKDMILGANDLYGARYYEGKRGYVDNDYESLRRRVSTGAKLNEPLVIDRIGGKFPFGYYYLGEFVGHRYFYPIEGNSAIAPKEEQK